MAAPGSSAPRKFSEKIALQRQRQAEETAAFLDVMSDLSSARKGDELEEGVTSEEFDKFLEERAKASERLPDLPSPPSTEPAMAANPANRKKQERADDTLFAL